MKKQEKEVAEKMFLLAYISDLAKIQLACGGSGGGGAKWIKC